MPLRYIHLDPGNAGGSIVNPQMETYEDIPPHLSECPWCLIKFSKKDQLDKHINDNHDIKHPVLREGNYPLPEETEHEIVNINDLGMLQAHAYEEIKFSLNHQNIMICGNLKNIINKIINNEYFTDRIELTLSNKDCERKFILITRIPDPDELSEIDKKFNTILCKKEPAMEDVNKFAEECRQFKRSKQYYDGLCEYIHGYLIKQQFEGITIPSNKYRRKFLTALQKLKGYEANYAPVATDFINFNLNTFKISEDRVSLIPELDTAIIFFKLRESGNSTACENTFFEENISENQFPMDDTTDFILDCLTAHNTDGMDEERIKKLQVYEASNQTAMTDKIKCRVLLAEITIASSEKKKYLNNLLDTTFQEWASDELKKIN